MGKGRRQIEDIVARVKKWERESIIVVVKTREIIEGKNISMLEVR